MEEVKTMEKASDEAMDAVQYIVVRLAMNNMALISSILIIL